MGAVCVFRPAKMCWSPTAVFRADTSAARLPEAVFCRPAVALPADWAWVRFARKFDAAVCRLVRMVCEVLIRVAVSALSSVMACRLVFCVVSDTSWPEREPTCRPSTVTTGISALRRACTTTTRRGGKPLARAVRT